MKTLHSRYFQAVTSDSILEQAAFKADETDMPMSPVVKSTELFLRRHIAFSKALHEEKHGQYKKGNDENRQGGRNAKAEGRTETSGETDDSTVSTGKKLKSDFSLLLISPFPLTTSLRTSLRAKLEKARREKFSYNCRRYCYSQSKLPFFASLIF